MLAWYWEDVLIGFNWKNPRPVSFQWRTFDITNNVKGGGALGNPKPTWILRKAYIAAIVVNYGISNIFVLEMP